MNKLKFDQKIQLLNVIAVLISAAHDKFGLTDYCRSMVDKCNEKAVEVIKSIEV